MVELNAKIDDTVLGPVEKAKFFDIITIISHRLHNTLTPKVSKIITLFFISK